MIKVEGEKKREPEREIVILKIPLTERESP